ncbi:hypothetical protein SERLADRAFT_480499 [Serpula lacrymans var. lacrymans S7.9]|uniref:Uncharacterized protein n=1 Tax=Serpula lacrymans var. lacrymans (strain S7.9) TaxID=578457 RepID=F8PDN1_SERL9|nr:uncharacterized protein SERLADRAFT_480499 [Serpula lacrymans var. lacrymans S7.9]EGO18852.1 hypothetical protein SERLADRAFT_480499 [Serpula lacrymans var. lacrymans S7.9]
MDTLATVPAKASRIRNVKKEDEPSTLPEVVITSRPVAKNKATPKSTANLDRRVASREPVKPLRRTRLATKETSSESITSTVDEKPSANTKPARRGRPTKKARELEVDELPTRIVPKGRSRSEVLDVTEDNDDDPLDSICQLEDSIANVEHSTRSAKSTLTAVKQENDEGTSGGRTRRGATRAVVKAAPSANNLRSKAASAKKAASIKIAESAATPFHTPDSSESGMEKENAPSVDEEDPVPKRAIPSRTKHSKIKPVATTTSKTHAQKTTEIDTTIKTRATRITRTRR